MVGDNPSESGILGVQSKIELALVISGQRTLGSSWGSGKNVTELEDPVMATT